ncbi:MAG: catalase [Clostridiales bacterium]|nr:catalase [Candidatus Equinaster intestinalis]
MTNALKHFKTITRHRHAVIKNCFRAGIGFQGLFHDLSKYSPAEFIEGAKYYQGKRSPNEMARETNGYSGAWMHHKGRNRHHIEYWTDYDPVTKIMRPVKMPVKYVKEMFCDRVAASKIYQGENYADASAYKYFLRGKKTRQINPETSDLIEDWLKMLAEKGEKETFNYVKNYKEQI